MNLVLAVVLFAIVLMGFGVATPQPVVNAVSECVVPASSQTGPGCPPGAPPTPAAHRGLPARRPHRRASPARPTRTGPSLQRADP